MLGSVMLRSQLLSLAATLAGVTALSAQGSTPLTVRAVRFYRAADQKTTVKAFVEVPAQLAEPIAAGRTDSVRYQVQLRVLDSAGVTLHNETWGKSLLNEPGASGVDIVEFVVAPGKYRLEATVLDGGTRKAQSTVEIDGYTAMPAASDLLLAPLMRVADNATDTVPQPGFMRRGNTLIAATAMLHLTPIRARAYYLVEAYNPTELDQTGSMKVAVVDSAGHTLTQTQPVPVRIGSGGGLLQGQIDLEGLPEGRYQMKVAVDLGGKAVDRSADFTMAPLAATVEKNAELNRVAITTDEGYFAQMSDAELDSAAAPLTYLAKSDERSTLKNFSKTLSAAAKRKFLTEFWQKRDADPNTQQNAARERFYEAIDFANRSFSESTRHSQPGWKTDRGRIYAKNGAPDDVLRRPAGSTLPYEVWRYTRGKNRYYIFADRTGNGGYNLLQTNDLTESSFPGWREILKEDAVQDIGRYVGVDFYSGNNASSGM
jgi:GWxTD domain-containing protein